jgi:hypothetical protein
LNRVREIVFRAPHSRPPYSTLARDSMGRQDSFLNRVTIHE